MMTIRRLWQKVPWAKPAAKRPPRLDWSSTATPATSPSDVDSEPVPARESGPGGSSPSHPQPNPASSPSSRTDDEVPRRTGTRSTDSGSYLRPRPHSGADDAPSDAPHESLLVLAAAAVILVAPLYSTGNPTARICALANGA